LKSGSLSLLESSGPVQVRTGEDDNAQLSTIKKCTGSKGDFKILAEKEDVWRNIIRA